MMRGRPSNKEPIAMNDCPIPPDDNKHLRTARMQLAAAKMQLGAAVLRAFAALVHVFDRYWW